MYMHDGIRLELERFIETVHATGAKVSGQLGHAGSFTKNREFTGKRPLGPSKGLNPLGITYGLSRVQEMTKAQIRERTEVIGRAAAFMKSVGFQMRPVPQRIRCLPAVKKTRRSMSIFNQNWSSRTCVP